MSAPGRLRRRPVLNAGRFVGRPEQRMSPDPGRQGAAALAEGGGATDTVALLRLSKTGVEVIETAITEESRAAGHKPGEIALPAGTVVATVVRDGRPTVPDPEVTLLSDDELCGLVSHEATEQEIHAAFQ
ncbi:TrkA C-terminal domain-containing protein [Streptomyces sp. NPDC088254]|uniref:TrkA C-terminal domain-containing protein n=1 Tax=Streptomyces sp. NPDC088254 TaxID=3365847 RepID=UPI003828E39D